MGMLYCQRCKESFIDWTPVCPRCRPRLAALGALVCFGIPIMAGLVGFAVLLLWGLAKLLGVPGEPVP